MVKKEDLEKMNKELKNLIKESYISMIEIDLKKLEIEIIQKFMIVNTYTFWNFINQYKEMGYFAERTDANREIITKKFYQPQRLDISIGRYILGHKSILTPEEIKKQEETQKDLELIKPTENIENA